jgi:hypothetical protein
VALEPAGVSLQAENFNKYIKQLNVIDKAQQNIFDVDSNDLTKAFGSASKAADKYEKELKQVQKTTQKTLKTQQQFTQGIQGAATGLIAFATGATVQFTAESAKLAAQFKSQQAAVNNLAATYGQSGNNIRSAISRAAQGTLSQSQVASAALTGLQFEIATTAEQFERAAAAGAILGRGRGIGAAEGITRLFEGIGKREIELLDELGISTRNVNAEMEKLAQQQFGATTTSLTQIQRESLFVEAALTIAEQKAAALGGGADEAALAFEKLAARSADLQVTFGTLAAPLGAGIANALSQASRTAQQFFAFLGAGITGFGTIVQGVFKQVSDSIVGTISRGKQLLAGDIGLKDFLFEPSAEIKTFSQILDEAGENAIIRFKEIASTIEGVSFDEEKIVTPLEKQNDAIEEAKINLEAYQSALRQAEQLQLSFARAAEDSALKLARANEDIARKQAQSVAKLQERQAKDRDKLLKNQAKRLDDFEANRRKQISKAEADISKARKEAAEQQKRDQQKLQRELQQAQERFNLSRLQSERRFSLSESRLRAEGDIIALKELREDFALQKQEEKENFDLSKKEQVTSGKEQQKEQSRDLESRVKELKSNLEDQRAELLASFDEQLRAQQEAQIEARAEQQRGFEEAAAERQIQLAREEEDRRISQARQLEDLGRSLAEQEGVTAEGSAAIANELEKVFGIDGTASNIMTGFTEKTESEFTDLFADLEKIVSDAKIEPEPIPIPIGTTRQAVGSGGFGGRIGGLSEFGDGGVVTGPGPVGSPQPIMAHVGETVLPTHQQSFTMAAPIIPSQNLDVNMSGGFNISGGEQAGEAAVQAAVVEMTETMQVALRRLARRN